ncbi:MAG: hypothetical protein ACHQJ6_02715 [Candidatus Berkiellales bacterium]
MLKFNFSSFVDSIKTAASSTVHFVTAAAEKAATAVKKASAETALTVVKSSNDLVATSKAIESRAIESKAIEPKKVVEDIDAGWNLLSKELHEDDFYEVSDWEGVDNLALTLVLSQIKEEDLNKLTTTQGIINYLREKTPGIEISQEKIEEFTKKVNKILSKHDWDNRLKIALSVALVAGSFYFGAPLGQAAAKTIFTKCYALLFGVPSPWSFAYWTAFKPMAAHASALGYNYGPVAMPVVTQGLTYPIKGLCNKGVHFAHFVAKCLKGKKETTSDNDTRLVSQELSRSQLLLSQ